MYEADPFAARKAVTERQEKVAKQKEEASSKSKDHGGTSPEFANAPEAKMAGGLRDLVEDSIRKVRVETSIFSDEHTLIPTRPSSYTPRLLMQQSISLKMTKSRYCPSSSRPLGFPISKFN